MNPKIWYITDTKSFLALDALRDIFTLAIHNIRSAIERQWISFWHIWYLDFMLEKNLLIRNHVRDVWDPKYDVANCVICVVGSQLDFMDKSVKISTVNVHEIKILYPVDELRNCLPYNPITSHMIVYLSVNTIQMDME